MEGGIKPKSKQMAEAKQKTELKPTSATRLEIWRRFLLSGWQRWQEPLVIFIGMRLALGALPFFAWVLFPVVAPQSRSGFSLPTLNFWGERLLTTWGHWDGEWFLKIATQGYQSTDDSLAFFPLYPLLVKLLGFVFLGNNLLAGVVLSSGAALAVLILLYELARRDFDRETAGRTIFYLAIFPTAFFLCAIYSESLFLALVLGSFLVARHGRQWWLAGILAALATLTRNLGVTLILPLAWEWWQQGRAQRLELGGKRFSFSISIGSGLSWRNLLALALPVVALVGWLGWVGLNFGNPLAIFGAQAGWDRRFNWPWNTLVDATRIFFTPRGPDGFPPPKAFWDEPTLIDFPFYLLLGGLFLYGCWRWWRGKLPFSYLLFLAIGLIFPLLSPAQRVPLLSFPRFALTLFPAFMLLAQLGSKWRWFHYIYLYTALVLLGLFFARFANWYWIA